MLNDFKSRLSELFTEEEKRKNEVLELIMLPYKRELTKEEEERYLSLELKEVPNNNIIYTLYRMAKRYIETGEGDKETYAKCMKAKSRKQEFSEVGEEWEKSSDQWKEQKGKEEQGSER